MTRYGGLILEGGGVKGVAYGGAAAALEAYGLLDRRHVTHFAGTSAGAMMGALLAARTPAEDIARYLLDFPFERLMDCLLYTSPSPRDRQKTRMPSSA